MNTQTDTKKAENALEEGRVYLRDTRNGTVHQYQPLLAEMSYMQRFIAGEKSEKLPIKPDAKIQLSGAERAAEFDRLAAMTNAERAAEEAKKAEAEQAQKEADTADTEKPKKQYRMTDKANGVKYQDFIDKGWTLETLLAEGYMEEVTPE